MDGLKNEIQPFRNIGIVVTVNGGKDKLSLFKPVVFKDYGFGFSNISKREAIVDIMSPQ